MRDHEKEGKGTMLEFECPAGGSIEAETALWATVREIINVFPFYVLIIDEDHTILLANDTVLKALGKKMDDVRGCSCPRVIHNLEKSFPGCPLEEALKEGRYIEKDLLDPFYKNWVSSAIYPMSFTTRKGKRLFLHVAYDITERKNAEEMIRQKNEFLNHVLESLTQPFYVIDAEDFTVTLANSAAGFGKLTKNSKCYALTHKRNKPCDDENSPCPIKQIKETGKPVVVEHTHFTEDGVQRVYEVHGYPVYDNDGTMRQILEYTLDITRRKRAEENIKKIQSDLEVKSKNLENHNIALNVLLGHQAEEKKGVHRTILSNINTLIFPFLEQLKESSLNEVQSTLVEIIESNLADVIEPFSTHLMNESINMSPAEVRIAALIKEGKTSKEIAKILFISDYTVKAHFRNIRAKLKIKNKKINLRQYLQSLSND